jgi:hypothetical protein
MFPGSTAYSGQIQSIFEEQSFGFNLLPSYQINSWNKLSAAIHYRLEQHNKYENAIGSTSVLATTLGSGDIHVQEMEAHYFTVAVEDQMNLNTAIGALNITLGISYDAQNFTTFRYYDDTTNTLTGGTFIEDDNTIWGTRDSFNPVIAALYDPIKDFLRIRTAFAMKTNFPTLETYKDIGELMDETPSAAHAIEPERIYSYNGGFELFFLNNALSFRCDYFYTVVKDKIESIYDPNSNYDIYTNLDSVITQGVENTVQGRIGSLPGIASIEGSLSYIYSHAENQDTSRASYGEDVEDVPQHQFIAQLIVNFITNTRLTVWGSHTRNQLKYVMSADPSTTSPGVYTQDVYTTVELHNPFMLHAKVQQELPFNTYVYVMCKNILDDYDANPFNPGPGRMFYFGGGGRL